MIIMLPEAKVVISLCEQPIFQACKNILLKHERQRDETIQSLLKNCTLRY